MRRWAQAFFVKKLVNLAIPLVLTFFSCLGIREMISNGQSLGIGHLSTIAEKRTTFQQSRDRTGLTLRPWSPCHPLSVSPYPWQLLQSHCHRPLDRPALMQMHVQGDMLRPESPILSSLGLMVRQGEQAYESLSAISTLNTVQKAESDARVRLHQRRR